ncbi:hypothetical protein KIW84_032243 [Lathyrus oleraceus]|uniref:G domain-containing protein n=1 Tax=Pisum sativum TaxID=3888 RepID=A0A9D5B1Z4_PEA|nr:hypothetical protein KIW84_032243 [Pisum sativum]
MSVLPSVQPFHEITYPLWLTSAICEIWFALSGILDQFPKWSPISREIYLDRLAIRYDRDGEPSQLALIDVFVSKENPLKKPPLITANTVLSILSVDYPVEKVSCYVSDDGSTMLTFEALSETTEFAKKWLPFATNTILSLVPLRLMKANYRVLVGPEAGFTRDAIRTQFEFQGRTIYLVDTAGWLRRTKLEKGASSLSIMQSRKSLLRAHIVASVLDVEEIVNAKRSILGKTGHHSQRSSNSFRLRLDHLRLLRLCVGRPDFLIQTSGRVAERIKSDKRERGAKSLETLISHIHPDMLADVVIANMKHLPKTPPTLARFENPSVGSQVSQSQVIIASASTSSVQSLDVSTEAQFPSTTAISSATTSSPSIHLIKMQALKVLV